MNFLAHLLVADHLPPVAAAGNLTADYCKTQGCPAFRRGVFIHRKIDAFTDTHEAVAASRALFTGTYRRLGGVLSDLVFDLCLSRTWRMWCAEDRLEFIEARLDALHKLGSHLPVEASMAIARMRQGRWLQSYDQFDGMKTTIERIAKRRPVAARMLGAEAVMEERFVSFLELFQTFYPDLLKHVGSLTEPEID